MVKWNVYVLTVYTIEFEAAIQFGKQARIIIHDRNADKEPLL